MSRFAKKAVILSVIFLLAVGGYFIWNQKHADPDILDVYKRQVFNLAINLLGAYVHTCRLQYVEFFGKFYEGGGRAFVPFKQNTKYVEIKEE